MKWKSAVDEEKSFAALLTDSSKVFVWLSHDALSFASKLLGNEFSLSALKLLQSYLKNRKQRTKINSTCSSWEDTFWGYHKDLN